MADIYNDQRILGVVAVPDGTTMFNGLPVIGVSEVAEGVLFSNMQRAVPFYELSEAQAIYNEQPVRGAVLITNGRTIYNGQLVMPGARRGGGGTPAPGPTLSALTGTFTLAENASAGAVAGALSGKTASSTLSLVDDAGGRVALSGTNIVRGATALDYETATSHSFTVRETLAGATNTPRDTVLTLTVTDVAEYTAESTAYFAAMTVQPDATRKGVIDALISGLKSDGLWAKLDLLYLLGAHDAQAARLNVKNPGTNNLSAVNSPTFTTDRGYAGDAVSAYLDTGMAQNATVQATQNSHSQHFGIQAKHAAANSQHYIGTTAAGSPNLVRIDRTGSEMLYVRANNGSEQMASSAVEGVFSSSRTSATGFKVYRGGSVTLNDTTSASVARISANITLLRQGGVYTTGRMSFYGVGAGLSDTEAANFASRIQTYLTAIGA